MSRKPLSVLWILVKVYPEGCYDPPLGPPATENRPFQDAGMFHGRSGRGEDSAATRILPAGREPATRFIAITGVFHMEFK